GWSRSGRLARPGRSARPGWAGRPPPSTDPGCASRRRPIRSPELDVLARSCARILVESQAGRMRHGCHVGGSPGRPLSSPPIEGSVGSRPEWPSMPAARSAIDCLLTPRSVAIVGASPTSYVGRVVIENLQALGFEGPIYPVNPRYDEVLGLP